MGEQDQDDDDGLELYVRKCLEKDDHDKDGEAEIKSQLMQIREAMDEKIGANSEMITALEKTMGNINNNVQLLLSDSGGPRPSKFARSRNRNTVRSPTSTSPTPVSEAAIRAKKLATELDLDHPSDTELPDVDV